MCRQHGTPVRLKLNTFCAAFHTALFTSEYLVLVATFHLLLNLTYYSSNWLFYDIAQTILSSLDYAVPSRFHIR